MYQSTENENIDITLDLRSFGVPWALHCWIRTLVTAHNNGFGSVIDELLQDFCKDWTEDNSSYFTDECLPVLFSIFRQTSSHQSPGLEDSNGPCHFPAERISSNYNIIGFLKSSNLVRAGGENVWRFRNNKSEGTTLFLADVLSACYGKDAIDKIVFPEQPDDLRGGGGPPRIDPKFVNNPELSDIQFRVEGRIFYAHKLGKSFCHQTSH